MAETGKLARYTVDVIIDWNGLAYAYCDENNLLTSYFSEDAIENSYGNLSEVNT